MSRDTEEKPVVKPFARRITRKERRKMVPFRHLDHPPHRVRRLLGWIAFAVVAFWFLHFVVGIGR